MTFLIVLILDNIFNTFYNVINAGSLEAIVAHPDFGKMLLYIIILLGIITVSLTNFIMYRIMRPLAVFIMARHAGFRHAWVSFVPYGTHYLEFVLSMREFNIFNWIKTDKRETMAWIYIANDFLKGIISSIIRFFPVIGTPLNYIYQGAFLVFKWRKYYDLLHTFGIKKSAMVLSILSLICKPLYVVLLFIMCDREPDYGWRRFDCPILINEYGDVIG